MKKNIVIILVIVIVVIGIGVYAVNTSDDPIISLSYFEEELASFKKEFKNEIEELIDSKTNNNSTSSQKYEIVTVKAGEKVTFSESTEFVIRRGNATIVDPSKVNGIPNLTTGKDDQNGAKAGLQQLYLVPRDDERGILAVTELTIMVRGNYKIK